MLKEILLLRWKAEFEKLDIKKLVNVSRGLDNLKIKLGDLDVDKLKTVSLDLKS